MSNREELKEFFDKGKLTQELNQVLKSIDGLDFDAPIIVTYCQQWFQSYFEGGCEESDFIQEIEKLDSTECSQKLQDFIKQQVSKLNEALAESKKAALQQNKNVPLADRLKLKNATNENSTKSTQPPPSNNSTTKKQVKILQKDEAKIQKAVESLEKPNEDEDLLKELEGKKKQRCKFFPNCKNETCPFVHPSEPCPYFPHCKYGAQCLKKHPECKFGKNCQRMDCFFDHPFPKKQNMNPLFQMLMMPMLAQKRKILGKPHFKKPVNQEDGKGEEKSQEEQTKEQ